MMKLPRDGKHWLTVVLCVFMIVLTGVLAVRRLGLTFASSPSITSDWVAYNENLFVAASAPRGIVYGAYNFRRPNQAITEYDKGIAKRLATLVERRATAADPDLIRLIADMMDPPSAHMVKM